MAARGGRAKSADRADPQQMLFGQLINELRDLRVTQQAERPERFKPPQYNGEGDIELFIQHFTEVAMANNWNEMATLLHLREALQDSAKEYSRAATVDAIFATLRSRYGVTQKEARVKLSGLRKDSRRSLHDHALDVEKLVRQAFGDLPEGTQTNMMLETFCGSLGHAALQRHLLAVRPETLAEAVQHGQEFLQVKTDRPSSDTSKVRAMEGSESDDEVAEVMEASRLDTLTQTVKQLADAVLKMQQQNVTKPSKEAKCWGCQKNGHIRKNCPTHPWTQTGNEACPQ